MAGQASVLDLAFATPATLSNAGTQINRYTAVVMDANPNEVNYGTASNATKFIGIAQEDRLTNDVVNVRVIGTTWVKATAAVNIGDYCVIGDANGGVATAVGVTNPNVIGLAITAAAAAGDLFLMLLKH